MHLLCLVSDELVHLVRLVHLVYPFSDHLVHLVSLVYPVRPFSAFSAISVEAQWL